MQKIVVVLLVIVGFIFLMKKCSPSRSKEVTFKGVWKLKEENGIAGTSSETLQTVTVDRRLFRIEYKGEEADSTSVYDGDLLHTKRVFHPVTAMAGVDGAGFLSEPMVSSEKPTEGTLIHLRFWSHSYPGQAGPGGQVAGQDTVLYQGRENRPEGEVTVQAWVDTRTGIVLKSVMTIYSSQVEQMVTKTTLECQQVQYGPVDKTAFAKP